MKASQKAYDLIKESEALRLQSYRDTGNILTIGYGHTFGVQQGQIITEEIANLYLLKDVTDCENELNALGLDLDQNQYDACIDFIFNLGIARFKSSTLLKKIRKNRNDITIKDEFAKWIYGRVNGKPVKLEDLVTRRYKETRLYFELI